MEKGKKIWVSPEVYQQLEAKAKALGKTADELAGEIAEKEIRHG